MTDNIRIVARQDDTAAFYNDASVVLNLSDRQAYRRMAHGAQQEAAHYDAERMADHIASIIDR